MTERCDRCKWWKEEPPLGSLVVGHCDKHDCYAEAADHCREFTPNAPKEDHEDC